MRRKHIEESIHHPLESISMPSVHPLPSELYWVSLVPAIELGPRTLGVTIAMGPSQDVEPTRYTLWDRSYPN